jgi:hypothetical protein
MRRFKMENPHIQSDANQNQAGAGAVMIFQLFEVTNNKSITNKLKF